jgi:hypothetical protein
MQKKPFVTGPVKFPWRSAGGVQKRNKLRDRKI